MASCNTLALGIFGSRGDAKLNILNPGARAPREGALPPRKMAWNRFAGSGRGFG